MRKIQHILLSAAAYLMYVLLTPSSLPAQTIVQGTISGMPDNATLTVSGVNGNQTNTITTSRLGSDGAFRFEVSPNTPTLYLLNFSGFEKSTIHLMLFPKDNITVELASEPQIDFINIISAKGSKDVILYQQFNNLLFNFYQQVQSLDSVYQDPTTDEGKRQQLGNQYMNLQTNQNIAVRHLLEQNSDVLISAFLVTYFDNEADTYIDLYETIAQKLSKKYPDNQFVQYVSSKVKKSLGPGRMAPEIAMKDPDGKIRKLSDLRGKVVMIDFWASWCRPCRMENPNVVKLYHKYKDKGFEIYSVSLDKQRAEWLRAIDQDGLVWPNHVSDLNGWTSSGGASYGITSVPSTVLIDREGRIIARNLRGEELARKLKEIFGE